MTTETSRNPGYAPFTQWSAQQAPVPQAVHNLPGTIPANNCVSTNLIKTDGYTLISAGITTTQSGSISIQRYLDDGGTQIQGSATSVPVVANVPSNIDVLDGKPFASFILTVTNNSASLSTINGFALLLQSSTASTSGGGSTTVTLGNAGLDGSTTITTGGTAQNLFGGTTPTNGFSVYNPDAANDLWISDSATASINGVGSILVVADGGGYETPLNYRPIGPVSVISAATGAKITARRW